MATKENEMPNAAVTEISAKRSGRRTPPKQVGRNGDDDVAATVNKLIAAVAVIMMEDGCTASEISFMRHDLVQTVCTYCPDTFRRVL
jgi:hypothetical protein